MATGEPSIPMPAKWPEDSPHALPYAKAKRGKLGKLELLIRYYEGEKLLPVVELKRVA